MRHDFLIKGVISLMLLSICVLVSANGGGKNVTPETYDVQLSIKSASVSVFTDAFTQKTGVLFSYDSSISDKILGDISIKAKNAVLSEILDDVFKRQVKGFEYRIINSTVVITYVGTGTGKAVRQKVHGSVKDSEGLPLIGAGVFVKGTSNGTVTDEDGKYELEAAQGNVIVFSYIGCSDVERTVGKSDVINVTLTADKNILDDVVVVGYGTQRKGNLTGSVSSVKSADLTVAPVSTVSNALAGKMPGLIATQSSGQPGYNSAALSIRGFGNALVIVDGIESSLDNIDANQIESVSILKDGAASIYGARAGNGVILVMTKRGISQKPTITLNTTFSWQGATNMLKPANAGQRAEMEREKHIQSGQPEANAPFTEEAIKKYFDGTDPLYPNTDWYKEIIRDWAPEQQHNISVRGGSDKIRYYGFFSYMNQQTMIRKNGGKYDRYNFQSNVDANIFENLILSVDLGYAVEHRDTPSRSMAPGNNNIWQDYWNTKPYYPAHFPDSDKVPYADGAGTGGLHVSSNRELSGYSDTKTEDWGASASLEYRFKSVKGLSIKAFESYRKVNSFGKLFTRPVTLYTYDPTSDTYTMTGTVNGDKSTMGQSSVQDATFTQQYSINYDNYFNEDHHVSAMALMECINYSSSTLSATRGDFMTSAIDQLFAGSTEGMTNDGFASEMGRMSFVGRINYGYKNKYLIETIFRADASAKFAASKRWGFFPSVSLGWVISKEKFMSRADFLDNLKLRLSYGQSGNDGVGNFQYLTGYNIGHTYLFDTSLQGIVSKGLANPNLTWEQINISNIGVDFSFFGRKLYGEIDAFYRERRGIPANRLASLPSSFGASLPPENLNSLNDRGFELKLGTSGNTKGFSYDISGNISWSRAKWMYVEEAELTDPDQKRIYSFSGKWTDCLYGYLSDGLFTSYEEIVEAPVYEDLGGNTGLNPGDVRYKDLNNDGKINWRDLTDIGSGSTPHWIYGINIGLAYKGFDLTAFFQGAFGYNQVVISNQYSTTLYEERWKESTNRRDATFARLGGSASNDWTSDFAYKKGGYLRLKTASLGYSLPKHIIEKCRLSNVRVYLSGTNLFTINRLSRYGFDPEAPNVGNYYPQQRTISLGLNISF